MNFGEYYFFFYLEDLKGFWGLGKFFKFIMYLFCVDILIYLGVEGFKNVIMVIEICEGWFFLYYFLWWEEVYVELIVKCVFDFEIMYLIMVYVIDDIEKGLMYVKSVFVFYVGGMGVKDCNFYNEFICCFGFEVEVK